MLQAAVHLCLMVPFIYGAFHVLIPGFVLAGVRYVGNLSSYMLLALTVFHVVEIAITPIPFRITHILPIVAYCLILCLVASMYSFSFFSISSTSHCIVVTYLPYASLSFPFYICSFLCNGSLVKCGGAATPFPVSLPLWSLLLAA